MDWTDAQIRIPPWSKRPSGLLVPTEVDRPIAAEVPDDLPPGVPGPPPALFVVGSPPSSFEQMRVFIDEEGLEMPVSTPDQLRDMVAELSFETCMVALAQLAAQVTHIRGNTQAQVKLAQSVFGDRRLDARIRRLARQVGDQLEVFAEQHITAFQRLLVLRAKDVPYGAHDPAEQETFNRAYVAVSCLNAEDNLGTVATEENRAKWLAYLIQNGTYNRVQGSLESMTRHQILLRDIAEQPELRSHHDHCDVDQWLADDVGFSLAEQFVLGFGAFGGSKALDEDLPPQERSVLGQEFVPDLASRLGRDVEAALDLLSADRAWYQERFSEGEETTTKAAWERTAFEIKPLLRLGDGQLLAVSPRAIESWLGDGFYHRSLAAARQRDQTPRFQRYYGALVEAYALWIMRQCHPEPRLPGGGRVFAEQTYGPGRAQRKSPDIAVDYGPDLVLMEVTSGRFTLHTLLEGAPEAAIKDLGRLLLDKADQLSSRIDDLLAGMWAPPDVDLANVDRIWPVIITADVLQNELLWDEVNQRLQGKLGQAKVQRLTLLDLPDLEQVAALVEAGHWLAGLLSRKVEGPYAELDFRRFVSESSDLSTEVRLSTLEQRWKQEATDAVKALGFTIPQERIDALEPRSQRVELEVER